jgi:hypothetical protein
VQDGARYGDSSTRRITFAGEDAVSRLEAVSAELDGAAIESGTELDLWRLALGEHELVVTGTDVAGNRATQALRFTVGTSFADVSALLGAFRDAGRLTGKEHARLAKRLAKAERGGTAKAVMRRLERFGKTAGKVDDEEVGELLARDADALIAALG